MKKFVLVSILLALSSALFAQGVFEFQKETHDFGTFDEGEQVEITFTFKNTGDQPIVIQSVKASCGCTTPFWTKQPVAPGQVGSIKARYNSKNRPRSFRKTITITSNATEPVKKLTIMGNAFRDPSNEPFLQLTKNAYELGKVKQGEPVIQKIAYKNTGKTDLYITRIQSSCNCVKRSGKFQQVKAGEEAILELIYTPTETGQRTETVFLTTNNRQNPVIQVKFISEVVKNLDGESMLKENKNPFGN